MSAKKVENVESCDEVKEFGGGIGMFAEIKGIKIGKLLKFSLLFISSRKQFITDFRWRLLEAKF